MLITPLDYDGDNVYINPAHIFGHKRDGPCNLKSVIPVTNLCIKNKDVLAAGIVISTVTQESWLARGPEDVYIRNAAHTFACLDKIVKDDNGDIEHCGDCTKVASSCDICIFEDRYTRGLIDLSYFEDLLQLQNKETKDVLKKFNNGCVLFMTVCQLQAKHWNEFSLHYKKQSVAFPVYPSFNGVSPSYVDCINELLVLPENEQMLKYNRMLKVREYIENPTPIEGIPWW